MASRSATVDQPIAASQVTQTPPPQLARGNPSAAELQALDASASESRTVFSLFPPPPRLQFTRTGRLFVMLTTGLGVAAVNTGNNLTYMVLGLMLTLIIISGLLSDVVLYRLRLGFDFPSEVTEGEPYLVEFRAANHKSWWPSVSVEVAVEAQKTQGTVMTGAPGKPKPFRITFEAPDERVRPTDTHSHFVWLPRGSHQTSLVQRTESGRGVLRIVRLRLETRFPFGLFRKWAGLRVAREVLVLPRSVPIEWPNDTIQGDRLPGQSGSADRGGQETFQLREYRIGDELRRVHWLRSARRGSLIVREPAGAEPKVLGIVVPRASSEQSFEQSIVVAASLARVAEQRGFEPWVLTEDGQESERGLTDGLRFLARLESVTGPGSLSPSTLQRLEGVVAAEPKLARDWAETLTSVQPGKGQRG